MTTKNKVSKQPFKFTSSKSDRYGWALQLIEYEVQRTWVIFGIFLLVETVLLGGISQLLTQGQSLLALGGSLLGLLLAIPWWTTFENTRTFYLLRITQAKELEPSVAMFLTEGETLSEGKAIKGLRMYWLAVMLRPQRSVWFLVTIFALAFLGTAYLSLFTP